ncbi:unnamed protein product [Spirodela intermedia]|uniref:Uncharacterized protein n=2 Tax=Spirodela intermedia TaxID=51605 RepID=A0A7I8KJ87_SPIIN|nr:unnamed protein product [Spirodela intermedia]CAA6661369.1 unnamed protein product [Spirodela intermedia]CAA7397731.1 unnamed protein product [Spirodela intermedia]
MGASIVDAHRDGAEICRGDEACRESSVGLLREFRLPEGLLPLEDIEEFGHHRESGFVWLRQRRPRNHAFRQINRLVSYATEVTGFVEPGRIRRLTGVKSRELLLWISVSEFFVDPGDPSRITFRTTTGISRSFPSSAFNLEPHPQPPSSGGT